MEGYFRLPHALQQNPRWLPLIYCSSGALYIALDIYCQRAVTSAVTILLSTFLSLPSPFLWADVCLLLGDTFTSFTEQSLGRCVCTYRVVWSRAAAETTCTCGDCSVPSAVLLSAQSSVSEIYRSWASVHKQNQFWPPCPCTPFAMGCQRCPPEMRTKCGRSSANGFCIALKMGFT